MKPTRIHAIVLATTAAMLAGSAKAVDELPPLPALPEPQLETVQTPADEAAIASIDAMLSPDSEAISAPISEAIGELPPPPVPEPVVENTPETTSETPKEPEIASYEPDLPPPPPPVEPEEKAETSAPAPVAAAEPPPPTTAAAPAPQPEPLQPNLGVLSGKDWDDNLLNIQERLAMLGYYPSYAVNGRQNEMLPQAIAGFQRDYGLRPNGIFDANTATVLNYYTGTAQIRPIPSYRTVYYYAAPGFYAAQRGPGLR